MALTLTREQTVHCWAVYFPIALNWTLAYVKGKAKHQVRQMEKGIQTGPLATPVKHQRTKSQALNRGKNDETCVAYFVSFWLPVPDHAIKATFC